jgi:hypothetical protein
MGDLEWDLGRRKSEARNPKIETNSNDQNSKGDKL